MKFGVVTYSTDYAISVSELARAVEARRFESLFLPEHTHIPVARESRWFGASHPAEQDRGEMYLPDWYENLLDPFVGMTTAAFAAPNLTVGTAVCLVAQHDPVVLAKQIASVDHVTGGGRLVMGVGAGWNQEEMRTHGVDPDRRWLAVRERIEAAKAIWANEEAEYRGKTVSFDPIRQRPKPLSRPHPPILIGGMGPRVFDRVARYADGWMPVVNRGARPTIEDVAEGVARLRRASEEAGRPLSTTVIDMRSDPRVIKAYEDMGVERYVFGFPPRPHEQALRTLDEWVEQAGLS